MSFSNPIWLGLSFRPKVKILNIKVTNSLNTAMTTTVRKVNVSYNGDQKSFFVYPGLECQVFENLLRATFKLSKDLEPIGFLTQVSCIIHSHLLLFAYLLFTVIRMARLYLYCYLVQLQILSQQLAAHY